jgi:hypothetical protein
MIRPLLLTSIFLARVLVAGPTPHVLDMSPLVFEQHAAAPEQYVARGKGYGLLLGDRSVTLRGADGRDVAWKLQGANPRSKPQPEQMLESYTNYLLGSNPRGWRTGVKNYGKVRYAEVYSGVDLVLYGKGRELEYDFIARPGSDPSQIELSFNQTPQLDVDGSLILGQVRQHKPVVYQTVDGQQRNVEGRFVVSGKRVRFAIGEYDHTRDLVIDPVVVFSTYLGGTNADFAHATAFGVDGSIWVTGITASPNLGGLVAPSGGGGLDIFVTKFSAVGVHQFTSVIGGSADDTSEALALDGLGNLYLTGYTGSNNFPVVNAGQSTNAGATDAFVLKLTPTGVSLVFSTYLGGTGSEQGMGIALNSLGVYIAGSVNSAVFAGGTVSPNSQDAFVAKYSTTGQRGIVKRWGGSKPDGALGLAIRTSATSSGTTTHLYVAGVSASPDMPQPRLSVIAGGKDAFVSKLSINTPLLGGSRGSDTIALNFTRYLGTPREDYATAIALHPSSGDIYLTGQSGGIGFPILPPGSSTPSDDDNVFVARLSSAGGLLLTRVLGSVGTGDRGLGIAVNSSDVVAVTGIATRGFPVVNPPADVPQSGTFSAGFVARFDTQLNVVHSFLLGDASYLDGIALDTNGAAVIVGYALGSYPVKNAYQSMNLLGPYDAVVTYVTLAP